MPDGTRARAPGFLKAKLKLCDFCWFCSTGGSGVMLRARRSFYMLHRQYEHPELHPQTLIALYHMLIHVSCEGECLPFCERLKGVLCKAWLALEHNAHSRQHMFNAKKCAKSCVCQIFFLYLQYRQRRYIYYGDSRSDKGVQAEDGQEVRQRL